ncbi:unnamed protein product [Phytophthora lilii]|uniref:Unnamed protein product n=1 Tax=Phytophthora lilii TaxID=2077276 RepID=A0A9W6TE62_9STRA|nr:unnamed protein product [Phytophthora lilii]
MDNDTSAALEAALAFIDEYDHEMNEFSSGHSSDDSSSSAYGAQVVVRSKSKGSSAKRNCSRDRQRLELLQLRAEADVLQIRLEKLQRAQEHIYDEAGIAIPGTHNLENDEQLSADARCETWKNIAQRQRKRRKNAVTQNQLLHKLYARQFATVATERLDPVGTRIGLVAYTEVV